MFATPALFFINHLLAAEAWAVELLRPHTGQTALLDLAGVPLRFTVGDDLRLHSAEKEIVATVTIRVPAEALTSLPDSPDALNQHAHIEGNAAFAETLATLLRHLRPNLAAWLAPHLGDIAATRIARGVHEIGSSALAASHKLGMAAVEGLRDESGLIANRTGMNALNAGIATLNARLAALVERIKPLS